MDEIYKERLAPTIEYFQKAITLHHKTKRRIVSKLLLVLAVILIIESSILIVFSFHKNESNLWEIFFFLFGLLVLYRYFTFIRRSSQHSLKLFNKKYSSCTFKINNKGYISLNENFKTTYLWNDFKEAIITDEIILLYKSWYKFVMFSIESYTSEEFEQIKIWIKNSVKKINYF